LQTDLMAMITSHYVSLLGLFSRRRMIHGIFLECKYKQTKSRQILGLNYGFWPKSC
jgi:hypothetical protein